MDLSKKIKKIEASGIRKIFNLAAQNKGEYLNFSIGQPHFPTPKTLKSEMIKAINDNKNAYTPTLGLLPLRKKIAKKLKEKNNINAKTEEVMISSGVAGGILLALNSLLNEKDEVILTDPYFVLYKQILNFIGAKPVLLNTYPDWKIDPKKLETLITKKTKLVILNSPSNPTGKVYSKKEVKEIIKIAKKHKLWVLSDEIYECFDYEKKFISPGSLYKKTITLNGFSKSHSITGWRMGYIHAPKKIIEAMEKLQQYTFVCAPSCAQYAIFNAFDLNLNKEYKKYKEKRDYLYSELKDHYDFEKPEGAFYAFIKKPKTKQDFSKVLIKNKILTVPGKVFSKKDSHFRFSFAIQDKTLVRGIKILKKLA